MSTQSSGKIDELVARLISSTRDGAINWRTSFVDNSFVATLKSGSVTINRYETEVEPNAPPGIEDAFELEIFDPSGRCGQRVSSDPTKTGEDGVQFSRQSLSELFRLARANAVGVEGVVDALIGELAR